MSRVFAYRGEFGPEIMTFIPFIYTMWQQGEFQDACVSTYEGMRPFYYFLEGAQFIERSGEARSYVPPEQRWWPNPNEHFRPQPPGEAYPDYATHFRSKEEPDDSRPIVFVQNKFAVEWGIGPINFLPLFFIEQLATQFGQKFRIVYDREGLFNSLHSSSDLEASLSFPDRNIVTNSPVEILGDSQSLEAMNEAKLRTLADASAIICVQGGGAHLSAYFPAPTCILHKRGQESRFAYWSGTYSYCLTTKKQLYVSSDHEMLSQFMDYLTVELIGGSSGEDSLMSETPNRGYSERLLHQARLKEMTRAFRRNHELSPVFFRPTENGRREGSS